MSILVRELGIDGYIEYLQDMGLNSGNYTEERRTWLDNLTPSQILQELKDIKPNVATP